MAGSLVIFGTGSFAQCAWFYFTHDSGYEVAAFTAHEANITDRELLGLPVVAYEQLHDSHPPGSVDLFVAVGYTGVNRRRAAVYEDARARGYTLATYVCSKATTWPDLTIGDNCFVFEDNTIQPFVRIGSDVVLWSGNHIGHHTTIGDHVFLTSHVVVSGHVEIGDYTFIGVNATIRDAVKIGRSNVIGAGAVILRPTRDKELYIGQRTQADERSTDEIKF